MGFRLSKIYTRKGDDGTTSVDARQRIPKNSAKIEALGDLDELNSAMGMILAFGLNNPSLINILKQIQQELFNLSGELCLPQHVVMTSEKSMQLEQWLDEYNNDLPPLKEFLLPGGNPSSASCHLARTICRRAERRLVTLSQEEKLNPEILRYINRLSDALFVFARVLLKESNGEETLWDHQRNSSG